LTSIGHLCRKPVDSQLIYRTDILFILFLTMVGSLSVGVYTPTVQAASVQEQTEEELGIIQKMIRAVTSRLDLTRSKRDKMQKRRREAELAIGRLTRELWKIDRDLKKQQRQLKDLHRQQDRQTKALVAQRDDLMRQIRLSYAMGRQDYLKIVLNQENPSELARVLLYYLYYRYFNRARAERIEQIRSDLQQTQTLQQKITPKSCNPEMRWTNISRM